ncbi:glycolate oxidase subunit GlcF [Terrihabitans sp. B22-R8]|uniref:glycolate oxidase subunit GlcF n=1 Tax=Terrihabitans sp. B22-R8 TaxID=3425128 RepID=UPI00403C1EC5
MRTEFSPAQLARPELAEADSILRKCVHCGFCTATCPTYVELGNELDSPRGRIYLIKDMLENDKPANAEIALHIDRCLSCLSCTTTCPSGVDYMHLIDMARTHVEKTYKRPLGDRLTRALVAFVLPHPGRFRLAIGAARLARPFAGLFDALGGPFTRMAAMLRLAPQAAARPVDRSLETLSGPKRGRVAILAGCAQSVLDPGINAATRRLLARQGIEVVHVAGEGCCGALPHHMGREEEAIALARNNVDAWTRELDNGLDAILITASGCGTTIKDYAHLLQRDPDYAEKAKRVSGRALDITEYLMTLDLPAQKPRGQVLAYHSACSLQHGQRVILPPKMLLERAGFTVRDVPEGHICCGSAGTYNILQPEIAGRLRDRKVRNIESIAPDIIAAGNIGCITQIASGTGIPIVHTAELLDWAYGGPVPEKLAGHPLSQPAAA